MTTPSPICPPRSKSRQRGAAIIIMALILMLGLVTLFTFRMDRRGPELDADRKTAMALAQAKEAILGRALINGIPSGTQQNPGALPCPDRNDDGETDNGPTTCTGGGVATSTLVENVGRVPWQTLDVNNFDGAGERLWYIVSPEYVDQGTPINTLLIAAPPTPRLRIVENGVARDVAGLIIAPGQPLAGQDRTVKNVLANYVEGYNAATLTLTLSPPSANYNDRVIAITSQEIFSIVTFRMARDLASQNLVLPYSYSSSSTIMTNFSNLSTSSAVWVANDWTNAVNFSSTTMTGLQINLVFRNCAITYTIAGSSVLRSQPSC